MERRDIKSFTLTELETAMRELGEKPFRARQLYQWMHEKLAGSFDEMTSLSKELRRKLFEQFLYVSLKPVCEKVSKFDGTRKYLFALEDGHVIESVLMRYSYGNSVCISSQVGCRMGCTFCASTLDGLERNLRASEMLDQVYRIQAMTGERVSHVVVMGSGEPLDNYDSLLRFIRIISGEGGLRLGQRNITVSTCGVAPAIRRLAEEKLSVTLALSLHAPDDATRKTLMPIAKTYALSDVLVACRFYFEKTGRRGTFEYSLVKGVNDRLSDARALAALLKGQRGHVNLIPVNPVRERDYVQSDRRSVEAFQGCLEKSGVNATIRRELGRDIDGACGQLRRRYIDSVKTPDEGGGEGGRSE